MIGLFDSPSVSAVTLTEFTNYITRAVTTSPNLIGAWVMAELSDVRVNGGHCYMELIEKNQAGQTLAKIRATVWQSTFNNIQRKFFSATGRPISTGLKVLVKGSATHHSLYGLSFNITDIDPSYTLGDMARIRQEILDRLQKDGIKDNNKLLKLNLAPQRIAVISAEGAAGYGDFINQLSDNDKGYKFSYKLFPAIMQGDRVSQSVREALFEISRDHQAWDCVAILRGGGATTDLNGFDDYELAKAVALFPLPVMVGIGHERDRTVLDEIANIRVKTPTAAAAFFINTLDVAENMAVLALNSITRYATERVKGEYTRIANIEAMVPALAKNVIASAESLLSRESARIPVIAQSRLKQENLRLNSLIKLVNTISGSIISRNLSVFDNISQRIPELTARLVEKQYDSLENFAGLVEALSPMNTLKRGYSITKADGKTIRSSSALIKGMRITTTFADGTINSEITD